MRGCDSALEEVRRAIARDAALACPGVLGARMTGGGFGGCAIALVNSAHAHSFEQTLRDRLSDTRFPPPTTERVHPSAPAAIFPLSP